MWRDRRTTFLGSILAAACVARSLPASAEKAVSIAVKPAITMASGDARLTVLVARNAHNRVLFREIDGVNYYRSSTVQLDGASSPRSYLFVVRDLPAGEFEVRASVRRVDDTTATDRGRLLVVAAP
jgi:hypothetical protein